MQIKAMLWFYLTPVTMATISTQTTTNGKDVREKEPSYIAAGSVN
jgi:hypothetical protein